MLYAIGVVIFALGLLASIALHEIGHMTWAKRFGVKVTQYMVGFGPTVWSRRRGDTEYGLKAIPLGGYIRMIGMVPPPRDGGRPSRWPRRMATAIEDFRSVSRTEVRPGDEPRQFYRLTPGKKMIVMLGGPVMNFVIYLVLTVVLLGTLGTEGPTRTISAVSKCVVPVTSPAAADQDCATPNAPAALAGLKPGDTIESIDGVALSSWSQAVSIIENSAGRQLTMVVRRGGADVQLEITPVDNLKYANDTGTATKVAGFIGVGTTSAFAAVPASQIPGQIVSQIAQGLHAIGDYPQKISSLFGTVFEGKPRDPNGAIGVVGIGRLGGEIAQSSHIDLQEKVFALVSLLASVNLLLFFFNLLPLLPLDGGHVAGALVEAAKRGRARLRARRDEPRPGAGGTTTPVREQIYVDTAQLLPVMYAVASVLVVITLIVVYADIVKPITIGG